MQLVPGSGQFNCTEWRKLNAYNNIIEFILYIDHDPDSGWFLWVHFCSVRSRFIVLWCTVIGEKTYYCHIRIKNKTGKGENKNRLFINDLTQKGGSVHTKLYFVKDVFFLLALPMEETFLTTFFKGRRDYRRRQNDAF